jgi:hypothetical protein
MGDSMSPLLFILYIADFRLPIHEDDVLMTGLQRRISRRYSPMLDIYQGIQYKVDYTATYCASSFLEINDIKMVALIFGLPSHTPVDIHIRGKRIVIKAEYTYVGIKMNTSLMNIYTNHYSTKALNA